jgi:hypothetical protein
MITILNFFRLVTLNFKVPVQILKILNRKNDYGFFCKVPIRQFERCLIQSNSRYPDPEKRSDVEFRTSRFRIPQRSVFYFF